MRCDADVYSLSEIQERRILNNASPDAPFCLIPVYQYAAVFRSYASHACVLRFVDLYHLSLDVFVRESSYVLLHEHIDESIFVCAAAATTEETVI